MEIKQINTKQTQQKKTSRPSDFDFFVGQEDIKNILKKAIISAQKREEPIGHILLGGASGYGKTTLAGIIANKLNVKIHTITAYAISKPADIISVLNVLEKGDIIFIDEIHRLHPKIEEILYIAMEDFAIDMVMPDGGSMRIPLQEFTLIGATTKLESLSEPLKNRFVYNFHFIDYNQKEKIQILEKYLNKYIGEYDITLLEKVSKKVDSVPREINNFCIKIRDFMISHNEKKLTDNIRIHCEKWLNIDDGGITPLHKKYLSLFNNDMSPLGIKTISAQIGLSEKAIENDIEPLLIKLGIIEKTGRGRIKAITN